MTQETQSLIQRIMRETNSNATKHRFKAFLYRQKPTRGPVQFHIQSRRVSNSGWRVPEAGGLFSVRVVSNITGR